MFTILFLHLEFYCSPLLLHFAFLLPFLFFVLNFISPCLSLVFIPYSYYFFSLYLSKSLFFSLDISIFVFLSLFLLIPFPPLLILAHFLLLLSLMFFFNLVAIFKITFKSHIIIFHFLTLFYLLPSFFLMYDINFLFFHSLPCLYFLLLLFLIHLPSQK